MLPTMPGQLVEMHIRSLGPRYHQERIKFWRRRPTFSGVYMTMVKDPVQANILANKFTTLMQKKAIVQISTSKQLTGFYSKYFLVPKKDGGLRPILDLRQLNRFIKVLPFKMLTTTQILESIEPGEWFASVDLKCAFVYVPIDQDHCPFLRFAFQDRVYQFRVLPFDLSLSPRVFTRVVSAALRPLQCVGITILTYLDDWLICAPSRSQVMKDTEMVIQHVQALGLRVNRDKSNLNPCQQTVFVGISLESQLMMAS